MAPGFTLGDLQKNLSACFLRFYATHRNSRWMFLGGYKCFFSVVFEGHSTNNPSKHFFFIGQTISLGVPNNIAMSFEYYLVYSGNGERN